MKTALWEKRVAKSIAFALSLLFLSASLSIAQTREYNIRPEKKDFQGQIKLVTVRSARANNDNSRILQGLVECLHKWTQVNARIDQRINLDSPRLTDYPFIYISTGNTFDPLESEKKKLDEYLQSGGFLLIEFDVTSYPGFKSILPTNARLKIVPADHPLYSSFFNIDSSVWNGHVQQNLGNRSGDRIIGPYLMGIWIENKLVGIYSDKNLGESWLGYLSSGTEDSRVRVGVNLIVYLLSRR